MAGPYLLQRICDTSQSCTMISIPGRLSADDCNNCDASRGCSGGNKLAVAAEAESGW